MNYAGSNEELAGENRTETAGPHPGRFNGPGRFAASCRDYEEKPSSDASTSEGSVAML